jgi:hypothetical protein
MSEENRIMPVHVVRALWRYKMFNGGVPLLFVCSENLHGSWLMFAHNLADAEAQRET